MNSPSTTTILIFAEYGLHCEVPTHGLRLLDMLNDKSRTFLSVEGGRYFLRRTSQPVLDVAKLTVCKSAVQLAILPSQKADVASKLYFAALERARFPVTIGLESAIVRGSLQLKSAVDEQAFLTIEAGAFFPVTGAKVSQFANGAEELATPVVLISKSHVTSIHIQR